MAAFFVFFGYFAMQIHLEEDINKLMPSSRNEDGTMKLAFADLKIKDKVFLTFEGNDVEELIETSNQFVDSLLQRDSTAQTIDDIFYQLDEDLMPNVIDYMTAHLPAYIDTAVYARFDSLLTAEHFARQMEQNREDLNSEFGEMFPELIQMDPMGMRNVLAEQLAPMMSGGNYKTIEGHFFVPDSTVCLAFITPRYSSTNTGQGSTMFRMMNELIEQFATTHPQVTISYHGTPANGFYNSTQVKQDLTTSISSALVLVLIFLVACFRRLDTIPLLLLPIVFGTLFALAMMYWLKGEFSLLALGIGGIVLGVAMSYVLHVLTHHLYVSNIEQLLRDLVKPVLLGCITTIGSFVGLLFVQTDLLRDFGLFAAFAILGTTLFSLIYLPHFFKTVKGKQSVAAKPLSFTSQLLYKINAYPFERNKPLIAVIVIATLVCIGAYVVGGTRFDADMNNLGYEAKLVKHSEQLLRDKTSKGMKAKYFASLGPSMEEAIERFSLLEHKLDSLQQIGLVKSYSHTNQILVPLTTQQLRIDAWRNYWTPERLSLVRQLIAKTAPQAGLRAEAFETFFETATADYEPDALYKADIIPQGYLSTLTEQSYGGDYLVFASVVFQNDSVNSSQSDYLRICDAIAAEPTLLVLDTYYYTTDTLLQMSSDFGTLQWLSMAFVFMVLLISFRFNWRQTVLGFAPILLSWLIVLGVMNMFDVQFNLISIIISTFIFGIGVDYSIFVMNGLIQGNLVYHKTAVLLSAIILIVTVSSMLLAEHPAIRSVGFSTLVGLFSAVILSYVLQPAVWKFVNGKPTDRNNV